MNKRKIFFFLSGVWRGIREHKAFSLPLIVTLTRRGEKLPRPQRETPTGGRSAEPRPRGCSLTLMSVCARSRSAEGGFQATLPACLLATSTAALNNNLHSHQLHPADCWSFSSFLQSNFNILCVFKVPYYTKYILSKFPKKKNINCNIAVNG